MSDENMNKSPFLRRQTTMDNKSSGMEKVNSNTLSNSENMVDKKESVPSKLTSLSESKSLAHASMSLAGEKKDRLMQNKWFRLFIILMPVSRIAISIWALQPAAKHGHCVIPKNATEPYRQSEVSFVKR